MTVIDEGVQLLTGRWVRSFDLLDYSWILSFDDDVKIMTESQWRFVSGGRVTASSEDHGHPFGLPQPFDAKAETFAVIKGRTVTAALVDPMTGDLTVEFDPATRMQFLQTSAGYESWRLYSREGQTICLGGGIVDHWATPRND